MEKAKYFYMAGFFLTVSPESILLVAEHALANKKVRSLINSVVCFVDIFSPKSFCMCRFLQQTFRPLLFVSFSRMYKSKYCRKCDFSSVSVNKMIERKCIN